MTFPVKGRQQRLKARIPRRADNMHSSRTQPGPNTTGSGDTGLDDDFVDEEIPREFGAPSSMSARTAAASMIPNMFTTLPVIRDLLQTETSLSQDETVQEVLPFLSGLEEDIEYNLYGLPHLTRKPHI